jgi:hypothetical protein
MNRATEWTAGPLVFGRVAGMEEGFPRVGSPFVQRHPFGTPRGREDGRRPRGLGIAARRSPFTIKKPQFFEPRKDFTLKNWKQIWRNIAYELTCDELSAFRKALADDVARQELLAEVERALACRFELMAQVAGSILAKLTMPRKDV